LRAQRGVRGLAAGVCSRPARAAGQTSRPRHVTRGTRGVAGGAAPCRTQTVFGLHKCALRPAGSGTNTTLAVGARLEAREYFLRRIVSNRDNKRVYVGAQRRHTPLAKEGTHGTYGKSRR